MCGLLCVWSTKPPNYRVPLTLLKHRGPDDNGIYVDQETGIFLGHTRLSIQDVSSAGHQPMMSHDGKFVIVYNGEIYNFLELRPMLEKRGYSFLSNSDTEVLINLYQCFGRKMVNLLNGIFSFVIWDTDKKELFVVRDAMGVKPLYCFSGEDEVVIASELKALVPFIGSNARLVPDALHRYLLFAWGPGSQLPIESAFKVEPGSALIVKNRKLYEKWKWGDLPSVKRAVYSQRSETELALELHKTLRQAVHRQMISDVPVGAFLSGGLDSSAIVSFAREINPDLQCFTIDIVGGPDHGGENDLPYAQEVARYLKVPLEVVTVGADQIVNDLEKMIFMLDEPQADPAALNVYYMAQCAKTQGYKVLLSGVGGDDLFTGYRRHLIRYLEPVRGYLTDPVWKALSGGLSPFRSHSSFMRRLRLFLSNSLGDQHSRVASSYNQIAEDEVLHLYSDEFRENVKQGSKAGQPMLDYLAQMPENRSFLQKLLATDQRFFLADHNLNYTDKMSMAVGVEVRVPFLDRELVSFADKIPDRSKQHRFINKWILRQAMSPSLPRDIVMRSKTGFGLPLRRWVRNELREMLFDYLSPSNVKNRGIFDYRAVESLMIKNDRGYVDAAYILFGLLCTEIWLRLFLDGRDHQYEFHKDYYQGNKKI